MPVSSFFEFEGLDVRRSQALSDEKTARAATNVYMTSGKVWRTRPGFRLHAQLPPESKSLYVGNGRLRALAPAGHADIELEQPQSGIIFDFVGDGTVYPRTAIDDVVSTEQYGDTSVAGSATYTSLVRANGSRELHWTRDRPDAPGGVVDTLVRAPFEPRGPAFKLSEKMWVPDPRFLRFSSTENGPDDYVTVEDAGFLDVVRSAPGDHTMTALINWRSQLVVFFEDSLQIWGVDPDPLNHFLVEVLNGPGTVDRPSVVNLSGDVFWFSRGGFRSLTTERISPGERKEGDVGAPIFDLTQGLTGLATASLWWQRFGLYLCAFGNEIYVFKFDSLNKVRAWSKWVVPWQITDMAELDTKLYIRTEDDRVYRADEDYPFDDGQEIEWEYETQFHHLGAPGQNKMFTGLGIIQDGTAAVAFRPDPRRPTVIEDVYAVTGNTEMHEMVPLDAMNDSLALRFQGTGRWQLDGYQIHYNRLGA